MKLTAQEQHYMLPGIYRGSIGIAPPNLDQPETDAFISELTSLRNSKISIIDGYPDFYPTPDVFLEAWITGYRDFSETAEAPCDRSHINPRSKGF